MSFLQSFIRKEPLTVSLLVFIAVLLSGSILVQAYSIVQIVTIVFIEKLDFSHTFIYFIWLAAAMGMRLLMQSLRQQIGAQFAARMKHTIREQLLIHWANVPLNDYVQSATGEKVSLLIQTVDEVESYYRDYIPQVIQTMLVPIIVLVTIFMTHSNSGWIMLITAPFVPITYILIGLQTQKKAEEQLSAMNRFSSTFLDLLQGLQTIRLFGQQHAQQQHLAKSNQRFTERTMSVLKIAFASTLFIELIATLGIGLVALEIGFQMIVFKTMTFTAAFFVLTLAPEYYNSLKELGAAFHTGRGSLGAATLLEEALMKTYKTVNWGHEPLQKQPILTLQNATLRYDDTTTIGPISMTIPRGQIVALIGPTGHGKTTTLNMLSSFAELSSGELLLNDAPRHIYTAASWYAQMSYISQHPYIFAATLRDNITLGMTVNDEQLLAALAEAQLIHWVEQLPNGLNTMIGEGGLGLSGGERQRVAIARAFVKRASIVFLDEPTAALDVETERLLLDAIDRLSEHATVIMTAHQHQSIRRAHIVYEIQHGRITASGSPEQFLKGEHTYAHISQTHLA